MGKPKVYVTIRIPEVAIQILEQHCQVIYRNTAVPADREELLEAVKGIDALFCIIADKIDAELLDRAKNLRVIGSMSVGVDHIDVKYATSKGVYVTYTPGVLTDATADHTWALLMATARRVAEADNFVRSGNWKIAWEPLMFLGAEVSRRTLGIVGLGRIGSAVAKRAKGFEMNLLYYDVVRNEKLEKELGIKYVDLQELLRESDFVSIHTPLMQETKKLIGERELRMMKKTAILINTARGPIVDENALAKILTEGLIAGAGLDVFETEPLPKDSPLLSLKNVVLTPHIASATKEARYSMAELAARNIIFVLKGEKPPSLYNEEVTNVRPLSEIKMI